MDTLIDLKKQCLHHKKEKGRTVLGNFYSMFKKIERFRACAPHLRSHMCFLIATIRLQLFIYIFFAIGLIYRNATLSIETDCRPS